MDESFGKPKILEVAGDSLWKCPQINGPSYPLHFSRQVARQQQVFDELDRYPVEKVLSHRPKKQPKEFLVRLEGYDRSFDSWVPVADFFPVVNNCSQSYLHKHGIKVDVAQLMHSTGHFKAPNASWAW